MRDKAFVSVRVCVFTSKRKRVKEGAGRSMLSEPKDKLDCLNHTARLILLNGFLSEYLIASNSNEDFCIRSPARKYYVGTG